MVRELGLQWVAVDDDFGHSRALRFESTDNLFFPVTMIWKRAKLGDPVDVETLFRSTADHVAKLGVSSYGCVGAWVEDNRLIDAIMSHTPTPNKTYLDVPGVIGAVVKPEEGMCAVFISTPKLLLDAFALGTLGFGGGQVHLDHTFKLLHEDIPFKRTAPAGAKLLTRGHCLEIDN